jgi:hypothetical protein
MLLVRAVLVRMLGACGVKEDRKEKAAAVRTGRLFDTLIMVVASKK